MLNQWLDPETQVPRTPRFWLVVGALVIGQLVAFWMLCNQQVRKAEARSAEMQMQQTALADCLQYIPGATIATCTQRIASPEQASAAKVSSVMPVGFTYR